MLEIELTKLIEKVEKCIEEKKSIKEGILLAMQKVSKSHRTKYATFQALVFKDLYKDIFNTENLEIDVLSNLLTVFSLDGHLSTHEINAAQSVVRVIIRKTELDEKWTNKKLFYFLQNEDVKQKFRDDFKSFENNINNSKKLLPVLIKYATTMCSIDGEIEGNELRYINDLEKFYYN